ncbi:RN219 protein, partial [Polyodon spathula]|nr:RN219 protein [Polyodon spathula]
MTCARVVCSPVPSFSRSLFQAVPPSSARAVLCLIPIWPSAALRGSAHAPRCRVWGTPFLIKAGRSAPSAPALGCCYPRCLLIAGDRNGNNGNNGNKPPGVFAAFRSRRAGNSPQKQGRRILTDEAVQRWQIQASTKKQRNEKRIFIFINATRELCYKDKRIDSDMVKEWREKLKVTTDIYERVKTDGAKLKEANTNLRSQNIDLVRANLRLKAEVDSRSPQKFGRCTVAALEAEIGQYERDVKHLRKALERSDKYIEELEAQTSSVRAETNGKESMEQPSVSKLQGNDSLCSDQPSSNCTDVDMSNDKLAGARTLLLTTAGNSNNPGVVHGKGNGNEDGTPKKDESESEFDHTVLTHSKSFSCLSLNSQSDQGRKKTGSKPFFYLRKLSFDDPSCSSMSGEGNKTADNSHSGSCTPREKGATDSSARHASPKTCNKDRCTPPGDVTTAGHIKMAQNSARTFQLISDFEVNRLRTSSEASMDAAYLDKISELDTMISESESSRGSHYSLLSTQSSDLHITLVPELTGCVELMNETDRRLEPKVRRRHHVESFSQENGEIRSGGETVATSNITSGITDLKEELYLFGQEDTEVGDLKTKQDFLQLDEISPNFFADSQGFSGNPKAESSHSPCSVEARLDQAEGHSLFLCTALASEKGKYIGSKISNTLPIKRKTRSGLDMASPSKASKLL